MNLFFLDMEAVCWTGVSAEGSDSELPGDTMFGRSGDQDQLGGR
jgi:hypothetical protein